MSELKQLVTKHNLDFLSARSNIQLDLDKGIVWYNFIIGTVHGAWSCTKESYQILAIFNETPGNGHFEDVFQWFEHSCKRDKRSLRIMQFFNKAFREHLIKKRGFVPLGEDVIKHF